MRHFAQNFKNVTTFSPFTSHVSRALRKTAFTLAEVLITLGIIGVVAALTMPTLVTNTHNHELQSQLKVAYSILQNGLSRMNADKGITVTPQNLDTQFEFDDPNDSTSTVIIGGFYSEYKNYFQKIYDCGMLEPDETICMSRANTHGAESGYNDLTYKTYNGNQINTMRFDDGQFVLSNGMLVLIDHNSSGSSYILISVDINGKKKKPNRLGQDLFTFQLMNTGKLLPMGAEGTEFDESFCSSTSTDALNGIGCAYKALTDKDYFKNLPK